MGGGGGGKMLNTKEQTQPVSNGNTPEISLVVECRMYRWPLDLATSGGSVSAAKINVYTFKQT